MQIWTIIRAGPFLALTGIGAYWCYPVVYLNRKSEKITHPIQTKVQLKKKRRERGEGEVDARPRYRHRAVVTCASDRRRVAEAGVSS